MDPPSPWKTPKEVMQLHKLKKRKKALQERMRQPTNAIAEESCSQKPVNLDFSRILNGDKRKNPFSKCTQDINKRPKLENVTQLNESTDKTLFALLKLPAKVAEKPPLEVHTEKLATFSNLLQKFTAEHAVETKIVEKKYKHLTIDWALKTKLRLMSAKPFPWTTKLKASEEASGITGFVRCLDTASSSTLDTSPRARFHQTCLYWQHPHLPWLSMFPRGAGRVAATSFMATNEEVKQALLTEWTESFRSLFQSELRNILTLCTLPHSGRTQLLRALHCPYFYVCANAFTCLFRAAGLCGAPEPCAYIAPTTRGFRLALRQEDVEFTMPLRPDSKKKLNNSDEERGKNSSTDSCYDTMDDVKTDTKGYSGDEEDPEDFLSQMGLETELIKKINNAQARLSHTAESSVDSAAESLVFVRGADAQALFNFLLNCKSLVSPSGPFGGVPPTLLAPTAFHGGTLQSLKAHPAVVYEIYCKSNDSSNSFRDALSTFIGIVPSTGEYAAIYQELRGPILPTTVHSLFNVLKTSSRAQFSATFAHHQPTLAFTWATHKLAEDESAKENDPNNFTKAFNKENLSDCGINDATLQLLCSADACGFKSLDSVKYNSEDDTYSW